MNHDDQNDDFLNLKRLKLKNLYDRRFPPNLVELNGNPAPEWLAHDNSGNLLK